MSYFSELDAEHQQAREECCEGKYWVYNQYLNRHRCWWGNPGFWRNLFRAIFGCEHFKRR